MTKTLTITEARSQLLELAEQLNRPPATETVTVTKRGKPVLAVLSHEFYESLVETLEVLADATLVQALRRSLKEVQTGKTIPWEKVKQDLRL
jgi:prevent-host-death family protein